MTPGPAGSTGDITGGCGSPCPSPMGVQIAGGGGGRCIRNGRGPELRTRLLQEAVSMPALRCGDLPPLSLQPVTAWTFCKEWG